jgi:AcrR family transcriptional regulator
MLNPGPEAMKRLARDTAARTREARWAAVVDEAAREFNARGVAGASLARIAKAAGVSRAALYYYVSDRQELALACYLKSCERLAEDLRAAETGQSDPLEAVIAFVRAALDPQRPTTAVLSELDYLEEAGRARVAAAHAANVQALRALIRRGIEAGAIRACDDEVIAQTLIGIIAWSWLAEGWLAGENEAFRLGRAEATADLLLRGQATDRARAFACPVPIERFFPKPGRAFDREAQAQAKLDQLLMTASQLFNRRGVDGVSLDDVGAALGATKGAVYHYLENKTDLVVRCYRRAFDLYEAFADAALGAARGGLDRGLIGVWLNVQAHTSGLSPLIEMAGADALPAGAGREITRRARGLHQRFLAWAKQAVEEGETRPGMDLEALAQLGAGTFQWLPKWLDPADPRGERAIANELTRLFIAGLDARP